MPPKYPNTQTITPFQLSVSLPHCCPFVLRRCEGDRKERERAAEDELLIGISFSLASSIPVNQNVQSSGRSGYFASGEGDRSDTHASAIRSPLRKPSDMELCPKGFSAISQLFSESVSDAKSGGWHMFNPPAQRSEVICPEPRRACRVPVMVDGLNRFSCKPRSLNMRIGDGDLEIVDILLSMDELEFDPDKCGRAGFFQGSPPGRTSNPIIRDVEFAKQSITTGSPLGMTALGSKTTSPRVDRGVPSCGSPLSGKPKIRVEGFSSSNSKSGCIVSARA